VQLSLHVSSGTYVRSIAHALGGHCTTLRRTAVGPFDVHDAVPVDDARLMPAGEALGRLPDEALRRVEAGIRDAVLALEEQG
jgi:tRNA pseudouridine55 synthase